MVYIEVQVSTDTAAKLRHEAARLGKTVEEVSSSFLVEGASTCAFLFPEGASTSASKEATDERA